MKIIDKVRKYEGEDAVYFSFEFFPPKTEDGVANLYQRLDRMAALNPAFIDVTWGAGGSTSERTLEICKNAQKYLGLETMMHLTCTNMPEASIKEAIVQAKEGGLQNLLALRGDPPRGEEWKQVEGGFAYASDLIKYIRNNWGDQWGICVAGYPEAHPDSKSQEDDIKYLKEKMDAGGDMIITQLFYDCNIFLDFVKRCRAAGITAPIVPGIMPIHTYAGFHRMTTLSKTIVPQHILDTLEPIKENDEAVKDYGVQLAIDMCKELLRSGIKGFHFYTLNLEKSVYRIVHGLGFVQTISRALPWRPSTEVSRKKEDVRPVFWLNRPKSYITRTDSWDDFPNGRWSDSRSPAYGDLSDYHLAFLHMPKPEERRKLWGEEPKSLSDLAHTFVRYCKGEIERLPWNEGQLALETSEIKDRLILLNSNNLFTINSQPVVNGASSEHKTFGWGAPRGYVYQKAYVEFFASPESFEHLLQKMKQPKYNRITFQAVNSTGEKSFTNTEGTNALTWGVFPGCEIKQPTVVDTESFLVWKDEAFALWHHWGEIYEEGSPSRDLIKQITATWYLVNVVDNDFVSPTVWALFDELLAGN